MPAVISISVADRPRILAERDARIEANLDLVRRLALKVWRNLPPGFDFDDLVGAGQLGLVRAATTFRPSLGVEFRIYASRLVHGDIVESIRRRNWRAAQMDRLLWKPDQESDPDEPGSERHFAISTEPTPEQALLRAETTTQLMRAMRVLTPRQREAIRIRYEEGETLRVVGERIGVKAARAHQIIGDALARLRRLS